jgi:hypothetical protein
LRYLVTCADRAVSKDELLDAVWPGQTVSESVLPKCVAAARRAIGDSGGAGGMIRTVHGRGYRFVAAVQTRDRGAPAAGAGDSAPLRTAFVGHSHAMTRLRQALESTLAGHGRIALLVGEPGIGKTRTADELAGEARPRGALVLVGRATEGDGAPAFWPWVQMLRAAGAPPHGSSEGRELRELTRELEAGVQARSGGRALEAEQTRFRLFDAVGAALERTARRQPLLLVLDDLHWADEASLRLLGFVARSVADARILIVGTYRDVELRRGHPLGELLGGLAREPACERIALRGFVREDTERLISGVSGMPPSAEVAAAVHDMTEGNPFFIQEVVRLLADSGGLTGSGSGLSLTLPQSVRDAIGRRLDALPEACNALLRVAAVIGREFGAPLLARIAELPDRAVLEWLASAVRVRVVDQLDDQPGCYRFHHSLIRQTLYDELSAPERLALHARAGAALEAARGADVDPVLDELAHHFYQAAAAGLMRKAIDYCARAALRSQRLLAYEQAARQYERALQVAELYGGGDAERGALIVAVGEAHAVAGARERAGAAFQRAARIGRELQRPELLARAALGNRGPGEMGSPIDDSSRTLLEEALAAVADSDPALRARLLSRLVGTPPFSDDMQRRAAISAEALELAHRAGDSVALRDALEARLWACLGPDHLDERLAVAQELLALARSQHSPHMALLAHDAELGTHLIRGDLAAADRSLAAYTQVAEALRQPAFLFYATFFAGSRALAAGELARAEQLFRAAPARGRDAVPYAHFMCTAQLYVLLYMQGVEDDPELNRIFFGEMMALPYSWQTAMRSALAFSLYLRGERESARREFEALAATGFEHVRRDEHWLVTMGSLSSVAILLGDRASAAQLYELLLPYADLVIVHDLLRSIGGVVGSTLGGLATLLGRFDEAERHFDRAHAKETSMGGIIAVMERPSYARLLLERNRLGDRARAAELLGQARRDMARFGIRRTWQLTMVEELGLMPDAPSPSTPVASTSRRISTKSPRNRQDSRRG